MKFFSKIFCVPVVLLAGAACSSNERVRKLEAALQQSHVPLVNSVATAEATLQEASLFKASLLVDADPVYSVRGYDAGAIQDIRVAFANGQLLSVTALGASSDGVCPGAIPLAEAIAIAEAEISGEAVLVGPDDDNDCHREVQVLGGGTLWEVKVGADGSVLDTEVSDSD